MTRSGGLWGLRKYLLHSCVMDGIFTHRIVVSSLIKSCKPKFHTELNLKALKIFLKSNNHNICCLFSTYHEIVYLIIYFLVASSSTLNKDVNIYMFDQVQDRICFRDSTDQVFPED